MSFRLQCLGDPARASAEGRATCDSATTATNVAHVAPVARATTCDNPASVAHVALSHALPPPAVAPLMADFQAALVLGPLVICGNCAFFARGAEPAGLGQCQRFATESWPFVPFTCGAFTVSPRPAAPAVLPDPTGARALGRLTGRDPVYVHRRVP